MNIQDKAINTIRVLAIEAIEKAKSGHPGLPLGAAPMAYELWSNHLNFNCEDTKWINRDRFILSAGHGSALLYSLMHLFNFDVTIEDLKNFRQLGSKTAGHPEYKYIEGIEATTGPLGQGIAMGVGMALAETRLAAEFNHDDCEIIDHYTYVLCGDGDLMEGVSQEASSLAGTLELDKLIVLYDSNNISIEGSTDIAFTESVRGRYEALHWQTLLVEDGNNIEAIRKALIEAKNEKDRPTLIEIKTQIGYGSPGKAGTASVHGAPLGEENLNETKEFLNLGNTEPFTVTEEVRAHYKELLQVKLASYKKWKNQLSVYKEKYPRDYQRLLEWYEGFNVDELFESSSWFSFDKDMASRAASGKVLNRLSSVVENLIGGSADLAPSNNSTMEDRESYSPKNRKGSNLHFGVREHAMAAIANGIALHGGLRSYVATFFVFSDYMKPSIRLSALMGVPVTYIFTHDSIGVGEDGPTHQPIEQLAMLRSIPNSITFRPADNRETAVGWYVAMKQENKPTSLVLSRQNLPAIDGTGKEALKGGYCVMKEDKQLDLILMASGSEVKIACEAAHKLEGEGYGVRVVSVPSFELFEAQGEEYIETILPKACRNRISIEAASTFGWERYVGLDGICVGVDRFGLSAPGDQVFQELNITADYVLKVAKNMLEK